MILVLAGTSEGRQTAVALEREGHRVMAATATDYGRQLLREEFKGEISSRALDGEELMQLIAARQIRRIVDATHPFAEKISVYARSACCRAGIVYERLERQSSDIESSGGVLAADDVEEAVQLASGTAGNIFLTVGSSKLEHYTRVLDPKKLIVRILPVLTSLEKCLSLGIPPKNIIAMQGPFAEDINRLLLLRYSAALVITKDSGPSGGTPEKINASRALGIPVIIITRPGQ